MVDKEKRERQQQVHRTGAFGSMLAELDGLGPLPPMPSISSAPNVIGLAPAERPAADIQAPAQPTSPTPSESKAKPKPTQTSGEQLLDLDTGIIRPWKYRNRPAEEMGDMESLERSIAQHGQEVPILVREIKDKAFKYEYYAGHRRYTACANLGIPVKVLVRNLSDAEAAVAQELENDQRSDISTWSKAVTYQRLLDDKIFPSEAALASHLDVGRSTLNELFGYFRLPKSLQQAVGSFSRVSTTTVKHLLAVSKEPDVLQKLIDKAEDIRAGKMTAAKIKLLTKAEVNEQFRTLKLTDGSELFTVRKESNGTPVISVLKGARDIMELEALEQLLLEHFERLKRKSK